MNSLEKTTYNHLHVRHYVPQAFIGVNEIRKPSYVVTVLSSVQKRGAGAEHS